MNSVSKALILVAVCFAGFLPLASLANNGTASTENSQIPAPEPPSYSNAGSNSGAKSAQMAQILGVGANVAMGGAMLSKCVSSMSTCSFCCAAAAMSFANAASLMGSQAGAGQVADMYSPNWDNPYDDVNWDNLVGDTSGVGSTINGPDDLNNIIDSGFNSLGEYGYTYDQNTGLLSTPDNGTFSAEVLNDPERAAAQGFAASDIAFGQGEAVKLSDDFQAKLKAQGLLDKLNRPSVSGVGVDTAGGGGGSSYSGGSRGYGDGGFGDYLSKMKRGLASKKKAVIAGKSKNYGGEQIGVKVDNIFQMIHRRYSAKRKNNSFIEKATASKPTLKK